MHFIAALGSKRPSATTRTPDFLGGCNFLENPALDARSVQPRWLNRPALVLQVSRYRGETAGTRFSLWALPGRKMLLHEGERLMLSVEQDAVPWRVALDGELGEGELFDIVLPASAHARLLWPLVTRLMAQLQGPRRCTHRRRSRRPTRDSLMHLRTLQALDGEAAGATHREIASAVFGAEEVFQRWSTDSELRAQLRYLLRRGHQLVEGGYKRLLGVDASARKGDFSAPSHPP